jgi:DNA polymerase-3 subunit epsilon
LRQNEDGSFESVSEWKSYIKPPISIPQASSDITGITDETVKDAPTFASIAEKLVKGLKGCDIMAYNGMQLDLPILAEECDRCGVAFLKINEFRLIDPFVIFSIEEPRTLTAALKFYCGEVIEDAHDALADVKAMVKVFNGQLQRYEHIPKDLDEFTKYLNRGKEEQFADYARKLVWKEGELYYTNWGKYKNQPVKTDWSYVYWILNNSFPSDTQKVLIDYERSLENQKDDEKLWQDGSY